MRSAYARGDERGCGRDEAYLQVKITWTLPEYRWAASSDSLLSEVITSGDARRDGQKSDCVRLRQDRSAHAPKVRHGRANSGLAGVSEPKGSRDTWIEPAQLRGLCCLLLPMGTKPLRSAMERGLRVRQYWLRAVISTGVTTIVSCRLKGSGRW
jgi:hypothetical protein